MYTVLYSLVTENINFFKLFSLKATLLSVILDLSATYQSFCALTGEKNDAKKRLPNLLKDF